MLGGVGTVWGPIIDAASLIPVGEILHAEFDSRIPGIQGVIYGLAIVGIILAAPEGIFWKLRDLLRRPGPDVPEDAGDAVLPEPAAACSATGSTIGRASRRARVGQYS